MIEKRRLGQYPVKAMKRFIRWVLAVLLVGLCGIDPVAAGEGDSLKEAIYSLPPQYFADIPLNERAAMMTVLSKSGGDERADFDRGWLHWFSDNSRRAPKASSMLFVKVLPREGKAPLILVHMPKPFATGQKPEPNQTFVLEREDRSWRDVTSAVIPKEVGLDLHFRPQKRSNTVEVAEYVESKRQDGRGTAYEFGSRKMDLLWDGAAFQVRKPASPDLSRGN